MYINKVGTNKQAYIIRIWTLKQHFTFKSVRRNGKNLRYSTFYWCTEDMKTFTHELRTMLRVLFEIYKS